MNKEDGEKIVNEKTIAREIFDTIEWVLVGEHVVVRKGRQYRGLGAEAI